MNTDKLDIEILEDGTLRIQTDKISGPNHMSADQLLAEINKLVGGPVQTQKRPHVHTHVHAHQNLGHSH